MTTTRDWIVAHLRVLWTLVLGAAAIGLAAVGLWADEAFAEAMGRDGAWAAWSQLLVDAARMPTLSEPVDPPTNGWYVASRLVALAFALAAVVTILAEVSARFREWLGCRRRVGWAWLASWVFRRDRRHVVVIGLGRLGRQIVADLRAARESVIVVEVDSTAAGGAEARRAGALVLVGDGRSPETRRRLGLGMASAVVVATGDEAANLDIASAIAALPPRRRGRAPEALEVYVHVGDPGAAEVYAAKRLFRRGDGVRVAVFNVAERAARDLFLGGSYAPPRPDRPSPPGLIRAHGPSDGQVAHWVVVGFGPMGQTIALQAARLGHVANGLRLRLTLADRFSEAAAARCQAFVDRHPGFGPSPGIVPLGRTPTPRLVDTFSLDAAGPLARGLAAGGPGDAAPAPDGWAAVHSRPAHPGWRTRGPEAPHAVEYAVHAEYLDLVTDVDAPAVLDALVARFTRTVPPVCPAVIVCFQDERRTFRATLALHHSLAAAHADGRLAGLTIPLYAYLPTEASLARMLTGLEAGPAVEVRPFGAFRDGELLRWIRRPHLRAMARALHEQVYGGDDFDALDPALQRSNEDAVAHIDVKLAAVGLRRRALRPGDTVAPLQAGTEAGPFRLADGSELAPHEVDLLRRMEHNRWMGERLSSGWRYGARSRPVANRRRSSFVPWEALTVAERRKDDAQIQAIPHLLAAIGQAVERQAPPGAQGT